MLACIHTMIDETMTYTWHSDGRALPWDCNYPEITYNHKLMDRTYSDF